MKVETVIAAMDYIKIHPQSSLQSIKDVLQANKSRTVPHYIPFPSLMLLTYFLCQASMADALATNQLKCEKKF